MPDFTVTDDIVQKTSERFGVAKEVVDKLNKFYQTIANDMKQQYLARIIRTMEKNRINFPAMRCFVLFVPR
jgi:hypothetical protein